MTPAFRRNVTALVSGGVFGAGLVVSGMTRPRKVIAFLDVFGTWDPSLAFVMASALAVSALAFRITRGRAAPLAARTFSIPAKLPLDGALIGGAAVFGAGWGLSGYCPGPSVVSLASGGAGVAVFVAATLVGIAIAARLPLQTRNRNDASELQDGSTTS